MALVSGGLGGLGLLASYELAMSGAPYVATTSRSGRIAGGQRELVQMQENFRQSCIHYSIRIDGSDQGAIADSFQYIQRPESQVEEMDLFKSCVDMVERSPDMFSKADVQKLQATKDHISETCRILEQELKARKGTSRDIWWLNEIRKKEHKLGEVIGKVNAMLGQGGAGQQEFTSAMKQDLRMSQIRGLATKTYTVDKEKESMLDQIEKELAAAAVAVN
mmetsp:Transcript_61102/g.172243  ORF Transcript_61102/g.172243 Transcript_61102/m.172243 type:complete len:220 (+) Transcript_61102:98-757(+)|eukprot:CAMPEP_0179303754 /NCGR_PEP_ID=MMETSP0797-20121207/48741_1 /TAXON_ID=47934 /ORGANISM="Dinophysis acuminata, Strain DAEP01" /LENGTH=219 /DNA_ID=CAMNT_0021013321 /DNA_START=98 /DNA_END=757 /DNA_ORIENTATION=+